uniref:mitogen-activated protein kinase kinase kinase n=1 Tax=Cajanus cajan TaxID=3821 RepID=A0A151THX5_CAJCA|nr:Mitogen-activated protein kinase kinase kinase ANP1 [Cajanus cajan]
MRSVFASQETRKNMAQVETRSTGTGLMTGQGQGQGQGQCQGDSTLWTSIPTRSAPTSPFGSPIISPKNAKTDDFIPYYYVSPKANQFWSAPEMPINDPSPPPAFFDISALRTSDNPPSPHHSPRGKSPTAPSPSCSSIPPRLSLDTSIARRETLTVHPLPLPPWAPLPSPPPTFSPPLAKTECHPMINQWQKGKLIGRGTFGSVYVATNRKTGALCAMKEAEIFSDDPKSAECIKQLEQEIKVLSHLKHPNIVQYYGSEIVEDRFYIYLEYIHPGSMNKYVREHCGAITECVVRSFTRHILSGLAYLHSKKTIHRDIKGANLLVDSAGVVKLADFGMAKHLTGHVADLSLKGSPYWMAPELMQAVVQKDNSSDLAFAVDIWSLGCTIIEMFTGKPPWSEYEGAAAMFKVMMDTPPIPETLSADGKDFLRLCFMRNPAERPTALMLLDHRFPKNVQEEDASSSTQLYNGKTLMVI